MGRSSSPLRPSARSVAFAALLALSAAGCGTNKEGGLTEEAAYSATVRALTATDEFIDARLDTRECIAEAGYPGDPSAEGVTLKDGSVFRSRGGYTTTAAVLDYLVVRGRCSTQTGLTDLADRAGVNPTPDVQRAQGINKALVLQMACMEERGWDIPEPTTLNGFLTYPAPAADGDLLSAYHIDLMRCNQKLWGTDTLGGY